MSFAHLLQEYTIILFTFIQCEIQYSRVYTTHQQQSMASSTRSRKTRKSRANAHMPGAARVRPRIQLVLSPKIQTNMDPIINTNNNNLVTPHVPSAAT